MRLYSTTSDKMSISLTGVAVITNFTPTGILIGSDTTATSKLDVVGTSGYSQLRLRTTYTPPSTAETNGNVGDTAWDDSFFYIKTSVGWKRASLSTF